MPLHRFLTKLIALTTRCTLKLQLDIFTSVNNPTHYLSISNRNLQRTRSDIVTLYVGLWCVGI